MDALIIVTHVISETFLNKCLHIQDAFSRYGRVFLLLESPLDVSIKYKSRFSIIRFDWNSLLSMGYKPIEKSMIPGSNHFVTLWFNRNNPGYRFYWTIEYDVVFTGEWSVFFENAYSLGGDFQSCHIRNYEEDPNWYWWNAMYLPEKFAQSLQNIYNRVRSFNPIYRISDKALKCVHSALKSGVWGHHEVVLPSILKINEFELVDFGGTGHYVKSGFEEKLYITQTQNGICGSMSHLPFKDESIALAIHNKLVHPIKNY